MSEDSKRDFLMISPENYHILKTMVWRENKPDVLRLHQAVWDAGYRVNGYKPPANLKGPVT